MAISQPSLTPRDKNDPPSLTTAYVLLTLTALIWASNAVAGKWAVGEVSPFALTSLRWLIACMALVPLAGRQVAREWHILLPSWRRVLLMGGGGFTAYNAFFYVASTYTTTGNITLFQGAMPVFTLACSYLAYRTPVRAIQATGVLVTLLGVGVAATHGDLGMLRTLDFNRGDMFMLIACVFFAAYTVALRSRPAVSGLTFFAALALAAFLTSLPLLLVEGMTGRLIWPTAEGWAIVVYVGLVPSMVSQIFFIRGVEMIGPNRAGVFANFVPIFGAFLAVVLVGEVFRVDNAIALALVLGGILIAERVGKRRSPTPEP